jgi:hypothetical protein
MLDQPWDDLATLRILFEEFGNYTVDWALGLEEEEGWRANDIKHR